MTTVSMTEARQHLSVLVDRAAQGEPFVITRSGKPLVRVTAIDTASAPRRLGFLDGEIVVPENFNEMGAESLVALFGRDVPDSGSSRHF